MKNKIFLTEEGKKEIETEIYNINKTYYQYADWEGKLAEAELYKEILSSAIILPVEESWDDVLTNTERNDCVYSCENNFKNGVIIQPKK